MTDYFHTKSYPDGRYGWFNYDVCNYPTINCYYDNRDTNGTLSLDELPPPPGATVGIALLSTSIVIILVFIIVWCFCYGCQWQYEDNEIELNVFKPKVNPEAK
jgi:hypothetical protein